MFRTALIASLAATILAAPAAHATNYNEGPQTSGTYTDPNSAGKGVNGTCIDTACTSYSTPHDLSSNGATPTNIGTLTAGSNVITGSLSTYGSMFESNGMGGTMAVGPNGELANQDMDYATFTVPAGYVLTKFLVASGTNIGTGLPTGMPGVTRDDRVFLGLASGSSITGIAFGPGANSAAGLLGFTLVGQSELRTDILPLIGAANPGPGGFYPVSGATLFTPPLGAGTYTLWLYDGDHGASYRFNAVVATAAVPEPAAWAMMLAGFAAVGMTARQRRAGVAA